MQLDTSLACLLDDLQLRDLFFVSFFSMHLEIGHHTVPSASLNHIGMRGLVIYLTCFNCLIIGLHTMSGHVAIIHIDMEESDGPQKLFMFT